MIRKISMLLMIAGLAITSCKKEDPADNPNGTGTVILEQWVDASGATLTAGAFTVVIPENAINTSTRVTLSKSTNQPFGTNQKSDIYFVNNLPESLAAPISISLDGVSGAENVSTFVCEFAWAMSAGMEIDGYRLVPHDLAGGKLTVTLGTIQGTKSISTTGNATSTMSLGVLAAGGQTTVLSDQGHFNINCPVTAEEGSIALAGFLEEAYAKYAATPFSISYANRTTWPVEVTVRPLASTVFGLCGASAWGHNSNYMQFNFDKISSQTDMRLTAGHEFLHFVQYLYDPRNRLSRKSAEPAQLWLDEAQAAWVESLFSTNANYVSAVRKGNEKAPFSPVRKGKADGAQHYGYGMSAMIKYLADRQGIEIIRKINEQILNGNKPAEAVRLATGKSYYEWYGNFIDQYAQEKLYKDVPIGLLASLKADEFAINTPKDTLREYTAQYGQLQSNISITTLKADAFTENSTLEFRLKNPTNTEMINVYRFNNISIENIGQNLESVIVSDIKDLATKGYKIMTIVTNQQYSYTDDAGSEITLLTRVNEKKKFKKFTFSLAVMCNDKRTYSGGSTSTGFGAYYLTIREVPCIQNGNVITATWDGIFDGTQNKGSATFTLQPDNKLSFTYSNEQDIGAAVETSRASGQGVPFKSTSFYATEYQASESYQVLQEVYVKSVYSSFSSETTGFYNDPRFPGKELRILLLF